MAPLCQAGAVLFFCSETADSPQLTMIWQTLK